MFEVPTNLGCSVSITWKKRCNSPCPGATRTVAFHKVMIFKDPFFSYSVWLVFKALLPSGRAWFCFSRCFGFDCTHTKDFSALSLQSWGQPAIWQPKVHLQTGREILTTFNTAVPLLEKQEMESWELISFHHCLQCWALPICRTDRHSSCAQTGV